MKPPGIANLNNAYCLFGLALLTLTLAAIMIGAAVWTKRDRSLYNVLIISYLFAILVQGTISMHLAYQGFADYGNYVDEITSNLFMLVEFVIFNTLLFKTIQSAIAKKVIGISCIVFPSVCIVYWIYADAIIGNPFSISIIELFWLVAICLVYFYELFTMPPTKELLREKPFWIVTGIFFYSLSLVPNFLIMQYLSPKDPTGFLTLMFISLTVSSILNLFFIKALLCKSQQIASSSL